MRFLTCRKFLFALFALSSFIFISGAAWGAQLKFAWDPNGEPDLAGYKVYYGTTSGSYGSPIDAGNVTSYALNGLTSGQTYYIAITAYDTSSNESDYSDEVSGTPTDTETISTPNVLSGPTSGATGVAYSFTTGGSSSSLGHSVQYQFDWKGDESVLSSWGSATQSRTWTAGGTYNVRARARCTSHTTIVSNWSSSLTVTINLGSQSYTITTNPSGRQIAVDSVNYTAPKTFSWTPGSSHTLSSSSPQNGSTGTRYVYSSWSDGGAQTHTITAPSSGTTYTANFTTQYSLITSVSPPTGGSVSPSGTNWYNIGQNVSISAAAGTDYGFSFWSGDLSGTINPASVIMDGPKNVVANFISGTGGSLTITPSNGLSASGNRGGPFTPSSSNYTLQNTGGASINWSVSKGQNWLNLSAMNGSLAPGASTTVAVSINDNANNLDVGTYSDALVITNTTSHNGDTNRPVSLNVKGVTVAHKIVTSPPGLEVDVDGTIYRTPKRISWSAGSSHTVSVSSPQGGKNGKLYLFSSWGDDGAQTHTISAPSVTTTYTASFSSKYSLTTSINNSEGGTITPLGADWYDKDQVVSLSASANTGYTFTGWSGSIFGKDNPKSITMKGPKTVRANFKKNTYSLTVKSEPAPGGSVVNSPKKFRYSHGEQITLTATPKEGYVFNGWGGDVSGSQNPMTVTVNNPMTVVATFTLSSETPRVAELSFADPFEYPLR
jgi:uncharacterized repeat protein (TIGR02543 family)